MSTFISRGITAYLAIDKRVRLISLTLLCPLAVLVIIFLVGIGKKNPTPLLLLFLVIPELFVALILAGIMALFMSEWISQVVQKIRLRSIAYSTLLVGIWWGVYSVVYLPQYIYNFFIGK